MNSLKGVDDELVILSSTQNPLTDVSNLDTAQCT
jgi:hypothetical protein